MEPRHSASRFRWTCTQAPKKIRMNGLQTWPFIHCPLNQGAELQMLFFVCFLLFRWILTGWTIVVPVHQASFLSRVLCQWENWCSAGLTPPPPPPPPNAERSVWVWEGLHWSDDHARLLGLLHQNARSGQQQESGCKNQFWKVKTSTFSGPGPLQRVDLTTPWTRYWNGLHRLEAACVGSLLAVSQLLLSILSLWKFHLRASVDSSGFVAVV